MKKLVALSLALLLIPCSAYAQLVLPGAGGSGGGGTPGGANTNVQFNSSSSFGGDSGFTYAGANGQITTAGSIISGSDVGAGGVSVRLYGTNGNIGTIRDAIITWATNNSGPVINGDTGLSRDAAGVVDVGNGTAADSSGTLKAAHGTFTGLANSATTSAVCYNTGTGVLTYDSTIGTCTTSTSRVKHDIVPVVDNRALLDGVLKMQPASFEYDAVMRSPGQQLGLIAEDMAAIDPRLVAYDDDGKPVAIRYLGPLFAYLIGALKAQQAEIIELKQKVH